MATAGPRNLITDVSGILVGQAEDRDGLTGTTVVLAEHPAVASVDVRGGAPGSRETELLAPESLVDRVDAIVLSGGSAFGLDAAAGVMAWLAEAGRGFAVGSALRSTAIRVPIVPAAILFDLGFPGRKLWAGEPPYRALGRAAVSAAAKDFVLGNAGAGLGATAGRLKGGIGSASLRLTGGPMVGAIVAVNSWGATVRPDCGRFWAADLALSGEIDPQPAAPEAGLDPEDFFGLHGRGAWRQHDDRCGGHRCRARQAGLPAFRDYGPGRPRPRHPPGPHAVRRRHGIRLVDRQRGGG
jgi:L-aminopeptidase/D-esterase-like protein